MVQSNISNLNSLGQLEIVVVMVETSVPAMETGDIDWEVMKTLGDTTRWLPNHLEFEHHLAQNLPFHRHAL